MVRILAIALSLAVAFGAWQAFKVMGLEQDIAEQRAAIVTAALAYSNNAREVETDWAGKVSSAQRKRETELQEHRRAADALRNELDGLRGDVAAFAAGPADDTLAACRERAAAAGDLLARTLQAGERSAGAAEVQGANVRALLDSWPVNPPTP